MMETGIRSFVMLTNRLATPGESDDVWKRAAERILSALPDVDFGLYECPYPCKRLMNPALLLCSTFRRNGQIETICGTEKNERKIGGGLRV
ncbi:hypothetical protein [Cohnella rhizosphaerae]|uniref:Uncharacterized protein n=1 Tax=Cohnella rhizosphaerae TaxID=1457232 RepID=A0A9X4QTP7_9BACL|nr:hypothetical protein [Cohnella rhizosphaerae]MDG0810598.1 hypothetical protein [Cohnella rhizosphaerae]